MEIADLITPARVIAGLRATGKPQALHELAQRLALFRGPPERLVLDILTERERLGSTGIGGGVAIPHGRLPGLDRAIGLFARLVRPIDFDAVDDRPVDLLFALLTPESASADHLKALALVARRLREPGLCAKLRASGNAAQLYALLGDRPTSNAA